MKFKFASAPSNVFIGNYFYYRKCDLNRFSLHIKKYKSWNPKYDIHIWDHLNFRLATECIATVPTIPEAYTWFLTNLKHLYESEQNF